jgi:hypothetical protein
LPRHSAAVRCLAREWNTSLQSAPPLASHSSLSHAMHSACVVQATPSVSNRATSRPASTAEKRVSKLSRKAAQDIFKTTGGPCFRDAVGQSQITVRSSSHAWRKRGRGAGGLLTCSGWAAMVCSGTDARVSHSLSSPSKEHCVPQAGCTWSVIIASAGGERPGTAELSGHGRGDDGVWHGGLRTDARWNSEVGDHATPDTHPACAPPPLALAPSTCPCIAVSGAAGSHSRSRRSWCPLTAAAAAEAQAEAISKGQHRRLRCVLASPPHSPSPHKYPSSTLSTEAMAGGAAATMGGRNQPCHRHSTGIPMCRVRALTARARGRELSLGGTQRPRYFNICSAAIIGPALPTHKRRRVRAGGC